VTAATGALLAGALALLAASRVRELRCSARNERALLDRGGHRVPGDHYPSFVALHAGFFAALPLEVLLAGTRPPAWWPLFLSIWAIAEGLRRWSMRALGDRWTARVHVVAGEGRLCRGPYRYMAHPNYLGAILELAAVALLFGAWRTALAATAVNVVLVALRVRVEDRALSQAEADAGAGRAARPR